MACLETKPELYSKWCNKILKNKFNINFDNIENYSIMNSAMSSIPYATINKAQHKIESLKNFLTEDPQAADLKWSLFVAACYTYKHKNCLKPFPPMYTKNDVKDIEALREAIEAVPPFPVLYERLQDADIYNTDKASIDLLHWVLLSLRDPLIKSVNKDSYESIIKKVPSALPAAKPNFIFEVASPEQSSKEERWRTVSKGYSTFFAYHGSRLENFHSILNYGIQQHMSKDGIFGNGIYLSSELGVSIRWSPIGYGWGASMIGSEIGCIALCELVNHPNVKKGDSENRGDTLQVAVGKKVPDKYYLALNSDLVRVRYILVYCNDSGIPRHSEMGGIIGWIKKNKFLTLLIGYVVLLVSVGLSHNKNVEKYYKLLIQKIGLDWPSN